MGRLPADVSRGRDGADVPVSGVKGTEGSRALHDFFVWEFLLSFGLLRSEFGQSLSKRIRKRFWKIRVRMHISIRLDNLVWQGAERDSPTKRNLSLFRKKRLSKSFYLYLDLAESFSSRATVKGREKASQTLLSSVPNLMQDLRKLNVCRAAFAGVLPETFLTVVFNKHK